MICKRVLVMCVGNDVNIIMHDGGFASHRTMTLNHISKYMCSDVGRAQKSGVLLLY